MLYLALGLGLLLLVVLASRLLVAADVAFLARVLRWTLITLGLLLAVLLLVRGQALLAALPAGIAAIAWRALRFLPPGLWLRLFGIGRARARAGAYPGAAGAGGAGAGSGSDRSTVKTGWLRMTLEHDSGTVSGEVLKGAFAGRRLGDLGEGELFALLDECGAADPRSRQLLESYLDRALGADWRAAYQRHARTAARADGGMSRAEAYRVLGLEPGADAAAIKAAHHKLMLKNHPDQGGSAYLATKINQAKEVLLGK